MQTIFTVIRALRILVGLALLVAVVAIFVHPSVDGPTAAQRRHAAQILIAVVALISGLMAPPLVLGGLPALFANSRGSAPELLALFCVRQC